MRDKDRSVIAALEALGEKEGMSQSGLAKALAISQGHLSKVITGKAPLSPKLRRRILGLVDGTADDLAPPLELDVLRLLRTSETFRRLMQAAVEMHNRSEQ
ncbi:helix-turn-helix transcriptional regulator [Bosea sp. 685]|uniref:helix-turn-helix transcriptional regulator n=1 Tax=Bosea sp. 685 TaxID=3080057 RepID=UPI00289306B8|nr:helix-turn-helix transcriptional regulator [Bosea sp. 685]WNJ90915.1 helix-turn-helix transcriptional regulator [Bosea sp. 685]